MADTSIDPLLRELQTTNGLTRELLREKREDDTPKSLFMGNMFEIFNARALQLSDQKYIKKEKMDQVDDILIQTNKILESLTAGMSGMTGFVKESVENTKASVKATAKAIPKVIEDLKIVTKDMVTKPFKVMSKFMSDKIGKPLGQLKENMVDKPFKAIGKFMSDKIGEPLSKQFKALRMAYEINTMKFKGKEKEDKKDRESLFQYFFGGIVDGLKGFGLKIQDGFKGLKDSLLGKAGLATALLALGAFLVSKFPALAEAVGNVTMAFVNLFQDTGKLFSGEMGFGEYLRDNFLTFIGLGLFAFKTAIITFFKTKLVAFVTTKFAAILLAAKGGLTAAIMPVLGAISLFFLKFVAIPYAIFKGIMGFFEGYSKRLSEGGGFFTSLIAGLQGAIGGVFEAIGNILDFIVGFVFDMFGGAEFYEEYIAKPIRDVFQYLKDLFTIDFDSIGDSISSFFSGDAEGKYMGGAVASGTPYIVGEKGPELFVPGASGSIIPNGGMGGGAPIIVTNNNVSAPTNTHSHQHSNVSITDNQQEITGL